MSRNSAGVSVEARPSSTFKTFMHSSHLSFREIGEQLFVSRNTVKTQAISVYRKLGVSSRSEAIARAADLGLVEARTAAPSEFIPTG